MLTSKRFGPAEVVCPSALHPGNVHFQLFFVMNFTTSSLVHPKTQSVSLFWVQFLGRPLLLGLPQVTGDGDGVHAGRHGFGWDHAELFPVRVVLVQALDHLGGDAPGPDAGQPGDLLRLGTVGVHGPKLASRIPEQHQEIIGFRFLHFLQEQTSHMSDGTFQKRFKNEERAREKRKCITYIKYFVLLALVDPAGQAAVRQGVLDDVFVGFCTRLLV